MDLLDIYLLVLCGVLGFTVSWGVIHLILQSRVLQGLASPRPAFHQTHKTPVPRLGGVAFVSVFLLIALIAFGWFPVDEDRARTRLVIVFSSLAMFLLGLWDDIRPLGARKKLIGQILIAGTACLCGIQIDVFRNPFTNVDHDLGAWGWGLTMFWLVALPNLINLIDGIDGLAGGVALMLMCLLMYVGSSWTLFFPALCAAGMAGALLAFLKYNFPPARIYMGDGGAYFLGYLIAILTLVNSQKGTVVAALIAPAFALALPIMDVVLAVLRRGLRGLPVFRADRKHIHHRLLELGFSRTRTVLVLYGVSLAFLLMAFGVLWSQGRLVPILFGCACLVLLIAGRSLSFSRDWFDIGGVLERASAARRETSYALALGRWLEMEAGRADSVESLWSDFQFLARKAGFARVKLMLADGQRTWESPEVQVAEPDLHAVQELNGHGVMTLEFSARSDVVSANLFEQLCELMAEFWHNVARRWQAQNKLPIRFDSRLAAGGSNPQPARQNGSGRVNGVHQMTNHGNVG